MNNIEKVSSAYMCSNCGACRSICPKDCISFQFSSIGRMYATVNEAECTDCGLCTKVCPSLDTQELHNLFEDRYVGQLKKVYVGRCLDETYFQNAQSGGVCTALLAYMFDARLIDAAIVTKMSYGNPPVVESMIATKKEDLYQTQKSCYTPVDVLSSLRKIKNYQSVALVGLSCHIQGVVSLQKISKRFLNVKYLLGLVCDKTLCKGIQDVMASYSSISGNYKIDWRLKNFTYNKRYYPYLTAPVVLSYEDSEKLDILPNTYRFALKEMFTPPRCRVCYDKINIFADIVLGDPWRMGNTDEKRGSSVVAVRTKVGEKLISSAIEQGILQFEERPSQQIVDGQLIDERRKSVALYSQVLNALPNKIESYLYGQGVGMKFTPNEMSEAQEKIAVFQQRETKSLETIVMDARHEIERRMRIDRLNRNIVVKILRKIKRILSL